MSPRVRQLLVGVVALAVFGLLWWSQSPHPGDERSDSAATPSATSPSASPTPAKSRVPASTPTRTATPTRAPLPGDVVALDALPPEARETVRLIRAGGPFRYERDGITFGNYEGLLPKRPRGYYREYTVPTPGSSDRGARRIVAGEDGIMYYSGDHYRSFRRIGGIS